MIISAQAFTFFYLQLTPSDYYSSFNCSDLMHSAMLSLFRSSYSDIRPVVKVLQEHYSGWQETAHRWSDIIVGTNLQLLAILSLNLVSTWRFWSADKFWQDFQFGYLTLILMKWGKWHIQKKIFLKLTRHTWIMLTLIVMIRVSQFFRNIQPRHQVTKSLQICLCPCLWYKKAFLLQFSKR